MNITTAIVVVLIIAGVTGGMFNFAGNLLNSYNVESEGVSQVEYIKNFSSKIDKDMRTQIEEGDPTGDDVTLIVYGGWSAITTILALPGMMISMTSVMLTGGFFSPPEWVTNLINALIWLVFIFGILALIFKRRA